MNFKTKIKLPYSLLNIPVDLRQIEIEKWLGSTHADALHHEAVNEAYRIILEFVNRSIKDYQGRDETDDWESVYIGNILNSLPGHGKTSSMNMVCRKLLLKESNIPLLITFKTKKNMGEFYDQLEYWSNENLIQRKILP